MKKRFYILLLLFKACTPALAQSSISISAFGVFGNGTDEGPKIQLAITQARLQGYDAVVMESGGTYGTNRQIIMPSGLTLNGVQAQLKALPNFPVGNRAIITTAAIATLARSVSITVDSNSYTFQYTDFDHPVIAGRIIEISGPKYATYHGEDYYKGWQSRVVSVVGTTVTMEHPAMQAFTSTSIKQYQTTTNVCVMNLHIIQPKKTGGGGTCGGLEYAVNSSFVNCIFESDVNGGATFGFNGISCINSKVDHCLAWKIDMVKQGYAMSFTGQNDSINYSKVLKSRSGIITGGRYYIYTVHYWRDTTYTQGAGSQLDLHGNAQGSMTECVAFMDNPNNFPLHGFQPRGMNTRVEGNTTYTNGNGGAAASASAIFVFENGYKNMVIQNNTTVYQFTKPYDVAISKELGGPQVNFVNGNNTVVQGVIPPLPLPTLPGYAIDQTPVVIPPVVQPEDTTDCFLVPFSKYNQ